MEKDYSALLKQLSLEANQAKDLAKNAKICHALEGLLAKLGVASLDKKLGNLFVNFVIKNQWASEEQLLFALKYIADGRLPSNNHVEEAALWLRNHKDAKFSDSEVKDFEKSAGVGLSFSKAQIAEEVKRFVAETPEVQENPKNPSVLHLLRQRLRFAPQNEVMEEYAAQTKSIAPAAKPAKQKEKPEAEKPAEKEEDIKEQTRRFRLEKFLARDLGESLNPPDVLAAHKERTKGAVITRFPPEPNGYLHIGHAKAINFSFKVAADHGGYTYLRYDDTNPEAESQEFIDMIKENVEWLGYTPKYITYASDNFQKIYDVAVQLIKIGKAFVCKLSKEEQKRLREAKEPSPYRDARPEVNLREFELMTAGYYAEGEAVLRAKIDFTHDNPTMRDPTIYRVKFVPHPHIGAKWCVYPLYDFVHSLCDCFEDITHSLCTLEFENRRDLYYWSLNELNLYRPFVWEYSRLNITYNVLSKRKVLRLVKDKLIDGWDDPRLFTLAALRRRGYPPEAIREFCDQISVTRRGNDNVIQYSRLEGVIRDYLFANTKHVFAVSEPVEVQLANVAAAAPVDTKDLKDFDMSLSLGPVIFLEAADVRPEDAKDFYGAAPGKVVRLRHGPLIRVEAVTRDPATGKLAARASVVGKEEAAELKGVKGVLHWLNRDDSTTATLRLYERLFNEEYPGDKTGNFIDDLNPNSLRLCENAKVGRAWAAKLAVGDRFQFERLGFFNVDLSSDLKAGKLVFNRIVGLLEKEKDKALKK